MVPGMQELKNLIRRGKEGREQGGSRLSRGLLLGLLLIVISCNATPPVSRGRLPQQHPADIARIEKEIKPSTETFAASESDLLWDAAYGYMRRVFPIERVSHGSRTIETPTLEWTENERPHRTQISVSVVRGLLGKVDLKVVALDIAPAAQLESIYSGRALDYTWELRGNLPEVEGIIVQQIKARHTMRLEGRSPELVPLVAPLPGLIGAKAPPGDGRYLRPGESTGAPSK